MRLAAAAIGCLSLVSMSVPAALAAEPALPPGFTTQTLASGLDAPTGFAFRPDGAAYVIEKAGRVHRVTASGARSLWLDLNASPAVPPVNQWWDRGLVGVAVDGQWPDHRFVYLLYVSDGWDDGADGLQDHDPHSSLLVRVPVLADGAPGTPEVVLGADGMGEPCPGPYVLPDGTLDTRDYNDVDCLPIDGDTHAVGTVRAAPDGTLFVGTGDGAGFDGIDQRALRSQREDSAAGKILHVDRDGRGVAGHPFCPSATSRDLLCAKTFATGFRNPFRFALLADGRLAVGEVGWGSREEVTVTAPGDNGGWPCWEGTLENDTYSGAAPCAPVVSSGSPRTPVGVALPTWEYHRQGLGGSVVGGPAYTGTSYPEGYRGSLLVGDYAQGWVRRLPADGAGGWDAAPALVTDWGDTSAQPLAGTALGGPAPSPWVGVDLGLHPANGDIVYADIGEVTPWGAIVPDTGRIVRIRYAPGNARPVARAQATPSSGPAPLTVELSAAASSDADGDPLTYAWDLDGDGDTDATTPTVTHTYATAGAYTATVTVDDGQGLTDSAATTVQVEETPPVAEILASSDTTFRGGAPITLRGRATDAQDGALGGASLRWSVQLVHRDHTHLIGTYTGTEPALGAAIDDHDSDSHYAVTLTATDGAGLKDSVAWRLDPETATVRLRSVPAGASFGYGDQSLTAPADHPSTIGLRTSVAPAATFAHGGDTYAFERWSTGETARVRAFTVPQAGATLTAEYDGVPVAAASSPAAADPDAPLARRLSAAGSRDPDGDALTCRWDRDGDGTDDATGCEADVTYPAPGAYTARLTVDDGRGQTDTATVNVAVNARPAAALAGDAPTTYAAGETLVLRGGATDAEDGDLAGAALRWTIQRTVGGVPAGDPEQHTGAEATIAASAADEPAGAYDVTLTATDAAGARDTATATLRPRTATVRLRSEPAGAAFTYAGALAADGSEHVAVEGARVSVGAAARLTTGGGVLDFAGWDDRIAAPARELEVPVGGTTLTARYTAPPPPAPPAPAPLPPAPPVPVPEGGPAPAPVPIPDDDEPLRAADRGQITLFGVPATRRGVSQLGGTLLELPEAARVRVAIARSSGTICRWWSSRRGRFAVRRSCRKPNWMTARLIGTGDRRRWRVKLRGRLPAAKVTVYLRAHDIDGEALFERTPRHTVRVRVGRR